MKLLWEHLPLSLAVGLLGGWMSGDIALCILAALIAGWAMDADHLVDFLWYLSRAGKSANYSLVKTGQYFKLNNKVIVPLHAWEITLVLFILAANFNQSRWVWLSAAIAHGLHLLQDQFSYKVSLNGYWFSSRLINRFSLVTFCEQSD